MPSGKHKNHWKGERSRRVDVVCPSCGTVKQYTAAYLKKHPVKYCSLKCYYDDKETTKVSLCCGICSKNFEIRRDKVREVNFCSKQCYTKSQMVDGAKWRDKEQIKAYMKKYAEDKRTELNKKALDRDRQNRDAALKRKANYRKKHADKIKVIYRRRKHETVSGDLTPRQWRDIKDKCEYTCLCCKRKEPEIKLTLDHIIPLSKGGKHTKDNVQPLCKSCNSSKNTKTIDYRKQIYNIEILET